MSLSPIPACFPFAGDEISLQDLAAYPLIVLERKCTTMEFLRNLFLQHHLELLPAIETVQQRPADRPGTHRPCIGFARITAWISIRKQLTTLRIRETIPARQMAACVNPSMPVNESTRNFLELLPTV